MYKRQVISYSTLYPEGGTPHIGTYIVGITADQTNLDDYSADINTSGSLIVGESVNGELEEAGDHDWFAITLEAGTTYQFDQAGPYDAFLYLRDSAGNLITDDDQSGGNNDAQIIYTATETGTYYLDASAYNGYFTGTYNLSSQIIGTAPSDLSLIHI